MHKVLYIEHLKEDKLINHLLNIKNTISKQS